MGTTTGNTGKIEILTEKAREDVPAIERNPSAQETGTLDELRRVVEAAKKTPIESLNRLAEMLRTKAKDIQEFGEKQPEVRLAGQAHDAYDAKRRAVTDRFEMVQTMTA